jgi:hypothetical protein
VEVFHLYLPSLAFASLMDDYNLPAVPGHFIRGVAYYKDGIRWWRRRFTKFCHRYNWIVREKGGAGRYEIAKQYARYHEYGNDAN